MKKQKREFVQRIESHYVADDCIQIMIPHLEDTISILNSDGIIYHSNPYSYLYINKYISDSRRNQFPYSQIPTHSDLIRGHKVEYINQLYDFNRVYITISDGIIKEKYVVKDKNEALIATKYILPIQQESQILNRQQFEELIKAANGDVFCLDGSVFTDYSIPSNEYILKWYKEWLIKQRNGERSYNAYSSDELSDYFYRSLDKLTIEDVPSDDISLLEGKILVLMQEKENGKEICSIKEINANYIGPDRFLVELYDFPITIYSLDYMKKLEQTDSKNTPEPKFPRFLNSKISTDEVKKGKHRVLSLKQTKKR
ncbi:MAG: hypothetical protein IKJ43_03800 [Bacilli bacterium]|nr:hypothetical protein [Bacilli bacterium]